jgi:hypothetical protein
MNELSVTLSLSDWLDLCALHEAVRAIAVKNLGNDPLSYSKISRITNEIESQVTKGVANQLTLIIPKSFDKD